MSRRIADTFARRGVVVVGIGADGWAGLTEEARHALRSAGAVIASPRQLEQIPDWLGVTRVEWRSARRSDVAATVEEHADRGVVVLASGDPLVHGIGRTLVEELGADRLLFLPTLSSPTLACARLGWPVEDVTVVNAAGGGLAGLPAHLGPDVRLLVLSAGRHTPAALAARLVELGYGASELVVLGDLGGPKEARWSGVADTWTAEITSGLNLVAVHCHRGAPAAPAAEPAPLPGLAPGEGSALVAGALLALLRPAAGELLIDATGTGVLAAAWTGARPRARSQAVAPDGLGAVQQAPAAIVLPASGDVGAAYGLLAPGGRLVVAAVGARRVAGLVLAAEGRGGRVLRLTAAGLTEVGWDAEVEVALWVRTKDPG